MNSSDDRLNGIKRLNGSGGGFVGRTTQATGFVPSFDFQLFQLPEFGELFANEFGASTRFDASMPTRYVDNSLSTLLGLLRPPQYSSELFTPFSFQDTMADKFNRVLQNNPQTELEKAEVQAARDRTIFERAKDQYKRTQEALKAATAGDQILCNDCTEEQIAQLKKDGKIVSQSEKILGDTLGFKITKEMGYLFIGVVILILLLLFARK